MLKNIIVLVFVILVLGCGSKMGYVAPDLTGYTTNYLEESELKVACDDQGLHSVHETQRRLL